MLSANKEELINLSKHDEIVKEVSERMFILNDDDTITRLIPLEEEWKIIQEMQLEEYKKEIKEKIEKKVLKKGLKKGLEKGIKQNSEEIAKKLLLEGLSIKKISEITKLSEKEIIKLKKIGED